MVKNPPSNAGDAGSIPGQGTKIPHAAGQLSLHAATKTRYSQNTHTHTHTQTEKGERWGTDLREEEEKVYSQWLRPHSWKGNQEADVCQFPAVTLP